MITCTVPILPQFPKNWELAPPFSTLVSYQENANYWCTYLPEKKTLYFNYTRCVMDHNEPFNQFQKKLEALIEEHNPEKLIIDLRMNTGGSSAILNPFINSLKKSYLNKPSSLFVLIGRSTMSSAVLNAVDLKKKTNATFIGEETGGNVNHYGEIKSAELPSLGVKVIYSTKYWSLWKDYEGGLKPDHEVRYFFSDFQQSTDPALELIWME
jgi:C-terminal processing protease CtpA/Prc